VTPNDEAAWEVHKVLTDLGIPYAIIGGIAVQHWGEARFTRDLDLTVMIPIVEQESVLQLIAARLSGRRGDALAFALRNRIYLAQTTQGFPVDISLALPGYDDEMVARTVAYPLEPGKSVQLCSAEDLIIHKAVAGRPQDLRDIEGIIIRQAQKLDLAYIRRWLAMFAGWLESDDVIQRFEQPWRKFQSL